jgi:hypothetical protein
VAAAVERQRLRTGEESGDVVAGIGGRIVGERIFGATKEKEGL